MDDDPEQKNTLQRVVVHFQEDSQYKLVNNVNVDSIELESIKGVFEDDEILTTYAKVIVQYSYFSIFFCCFQIGPLIISIFQLFQIKALISGQIKCKRRSIRRLQTCVGSYSNISEILIYFGLVLYITMVLNFGIV